MKRDCWRWTGAIAAATGTQPQATPASLSAPSRKEPPMKAEARLLARAVGRMSWATPYTTPRILRWRALTKGTSDEGVYHNVQRK